MNTSPYFTHAAIWSLAIFLMGSSGCATNPYQERADLIKGHVESFYDSLKANRVEGAIHANQKIEAIASEMGESIRKRMQQPGMNQPDQEWALLKTTNETAAENWLALARYFTVKKQYDQARTTYQRIITTYRSTNNGSYADQADRGLKDLEMLSPTTAK
jgi:DUF1680 family protein